MSPLSCIEMIHDLEPSPLMQRHPNEELSKEIQMWLASPFPTPLVLPEQLSPPMSALPAETAKKPAKKASPSLMERAKSGSLFHRKARLAACVV